MFILEALAKLPSLKITMVRKPKKNTSYHSVYYVIQILVMVQIQHKTLGLLRVMT